MKVALDTSKKKAELAEAAKQLKEELEIADIEWPTGSGTIWQVRSIDRGRMRETIETARDIGVPPETTTDWILADNTTRPTTAADLRAVITAYTLRMGEIYRTYNTWRASGITAPFTGNLT